MKSVCLTQLINPRKLWNIQLLQEKKANTEDGTTATPPGNEIHHNQVPPSYFQYSGMMVPYVDGPKWTSYPSREC